ncbi:NAD-dependent malic enzyme [Balamuthia mandrillaris]
MEKATKAAPKLHRHNTLHRPDHFIHHNKPLILENSHYNKGTAFLESERDALGIRGLLPPHVESMEDQVERTLHHLRSFNKNIDKFIYLQSLKHRNQTLFYRLLVSNLEETMPLVYTPTVGEACQNFSLNFRAADGMFFCKQDKGKMRQMLDNWPYRTVDIIVVTDGSRILGLGDLGANGMGIPIGKLSLYVAAAGFHPMRTLPVLIDSGTNNEDNLKDPRYLGMRHKRLPDPEFYELVDEFLMAVKDKWPECLVQFEDFSNDHCFDLLTKYRDRLLCFNDDIQGTGAVVAAGFLQAVKLSGKQLKDQRVLFLGAGSAAVGVADAIVSMMLLADEELASGAEDTAEVTEQKRAQLRKRFWLIDSRGLVTSGREGKLEAHKEPYAHDCEKRIANLKEAVDFLKPTALIGLAGQPGGSFTSEILQKVAELNERPIIFALSNPTSKAECTAEAAYKETNGTAIFAAGSPFDPVTIGDKTFVPGQGNNMYIFPGLGYGAVLARATKVTDAMISAAAVALSNCVTEEELAQGRIYPKLDRIRDISARVAATVMEKAFEEGVAQINRPENILEMVQSSMYFPSYYNFGE